MHLTKEWSPGTGGKIRRIFYKGFGEARSGRLSESQEGLTERNCASMAAPFAPFSFF